MQKAFDLSEVRFIKRITIGDHEVSSDRTEGEAADNMALLNRCLSEPPYGTVLSMEKRFALLNTGEHQIVVQWIVYHVGFRRMPAWLNDGGSLL